MAQWKGKVTETQTKFDSAKFWEFAVLDLVPQLPTTRDSFRPIKLFPNSFVHDGVRHLKAKSIVYIRCKKEEEQESDDAILIDYRKTYQAYIDIFRSKFYKGRLFKYIQHFFVQSLIDTYFFDRASKKRLVDYDMISDSSLSRWKNSKTHAEGEVFFTATLLLLKKPLNELKLKEGNTRVNEKSWGKVLDELRQELQALGYGENEGLLGGSNKIVKLSKTPFDVSLGVYELIQSEEIDVSEELLEFIKAQNYFRDKGISGKLASFFEKVRGSYDKQWVKFGDPKKDPELVYKRLHRHLRDWFFATALIVITCPADWLESEWFA